MSEPQKRSVAVESEGENYAGITEEQVRSAIAASGYPLQFYVGETLAQVASQYGVRLRDEWTFIDSKTNEARSLDIRVDLYLPGHDAGLKTRPILTLLIECKQSVMPYTFFCKREGAPMGRYPLIAGLHSEEIEVKTDDTRSSWSLPIIHVLGLDSERFVSKPMPCRTFSKCARRGKHIELSGTEAYSSIVHPLTKALQHLSQSEAPASTHAYFDAHLTIALAVIDGPMFAITVENGNERLESVSWVRVLRHEHIPSAEYHHRDRTYGIEVVQREYLSEFIVDNLLPFAESFAHKATKHANELSSGRGFISGMEADSISDLPNRLQKR